MSGRSIWIWFEERSQSQWSMLSFVLLCLAGLYFPTISPYIQGGDSGELVVTAWRLATPHPPGYPLYTALGHIFTWIPVSTLAWRMGFFSAVCQLLACGIFFILVNVWLKDLVVAMVVTLFFGCAPLAWQMAIEPEVFALNNLFAVGVLSTIYRYQVTRDSRWTWATCALLGLATCHHMTLLLMAFPMVVALLVINWRQMMRPRVWVGGLALFVVFLSPYLLLFWLGQHREIFAWGDFSSWNGFWTHVLRKEYGTFQLAPGWKENSGIGPKLYYFGREMFSNTRWVLLGFFGWGVVQLRMATPRAQFARLVTGALIFYVLVFHSLSNLDLSIPLYNHTQARMWILPLMLIVLVAGFGLTEVRGQLKSPLARRGLTTVLLLILAGGVYGNWSQLDESERDFFERVGHSMIDNVEPGAVVLMREDALVNSLRYLQAALNVRPDVHVIPYDALWWPWMKPLVQHNFPEFNFPGDVVRDRAVQPGEFTLRQLMEANVQKFPIYMANITPREEETLHNVVAGFPAGFDSRVKPAGAKFTLAEIATATDLFLKLRLPTDQQHPWASWETYLMKNYAVVRPMIGVVLMRLAEGRPEWILAGLSVLEDSLKVPHVVEGDIYKNLAIGYSTLATTNPQFRPATVRALESYFRAHTEDDTESQGLRNILQQLKAEGWDRQ